MNWRRIAHILKMEKSLKEFLVSVIHSLPPSQGNFWQEFLHVSQDISPFAVPVGLAATLMSLLSAVFVAYKWRRTKSKFNKIQSDDPVCDTGGRETEKNNLHESKSERESLIKENHELEKEMTQLKNKYEQQLEDQKKESDNLQEKMANGLKTARRDLEMMKTNPIQRRQNFTESLKNTLAMQRIRRLEDQIKTLSVSQVNSCLAHNDPLLTRRKREAEKTQTMILDTIKRVRESFPSLKQAVAMARIHKLEDQMKHLSVSQVNSCLVINDTPMTRKKREAEKTQILDTIKRVRGSFPSLKQAVAMARIHKLEDQIKEKEILQEQMENDLKTARRDLEEADSNLRQKDDELQKIIERLKETTEEHKQQTVLHESKSETESLIKKNQELEKEMTQLKNKYEQQSDAEAQQELKDEQQESSDATESPNELKTELENENQKQNKEQPERFLVAEELKVETELSEGRDLRKELQDLKIYSELLAEKNQQLEAQLAELKERYKQEFRTRIEEEQQWREELEEDVEILRKELEKQTEYRAIQAGAESEIHGDKVSVPEDSR
ncbi:trichohyalin-like [Cyprinodon tularosa]|uniref:trichohyalin-like n=1 Tax=Cyprinodon tularosa TaxID=77115 RepID=UPI0018E28EC6|nr:trichohyalin-like [Cyprinodon tularosa]